MDSSLLLIQPEQVFGSVLDREEKRDFQHERALACIKYDHLGPKLLFNGREFETMFRVSRGRFQCLMEDIKKAEIPFCSGKPDARKIQKFEL